MDSGPELRQDRLGDGTMADNDDGSRGHRVDFMGLPGPFELPRCGSPVSALPVDEQTIVLELTTETGNQLVRIPLSAECLVAIEPMIRHLVRTRGMGQTKQ